MLTFNLALCALAVLTCAACTAVLFYKHAGTGSRFLFWTGICFTFLTLNNVLLFLDLVVLEQDLRVWRHATALPALVAMTVGLLAEAD